MDAISLIQNVKMAKEMFNLAAVKDDVDAMYILVLMLYNDNSGDKDDENAK